MSSNVVVADVTRHDSRQEHVSSRQTLRDIVFDRDLGAAAGLMIITRAVSRVSLCATRSQSASALGPQAAAAAAAAARSLQLLGHDSRRVDVAALLHLQGRGGT